MEIQKTEMTPHITYNAGKFLLDGNEIVNPEVLKDHKGFHLIEGQWFVSIREVPGLHPVVDGSVWSLPEMMWPQMESMGTCCSPLAPNNHYTECNKCEGYTERKVVRLVEVERVKNRIGEIADELGDKVTPVDKQDLKRLQDTFAKTAADYETAFPEPEKQAIDDTLKIDAGKALKGLIKLGDAPSNESLGIWFYKWDRTVIDALKSASQPPPAINERVDRAVKLFYGDWVTELADKTWQKLIRQNWSNVSGEIETAIREALKSSHPPPQAESHSRQEIEELKAENEKLREALKNCLDELLYESATGAIYLQVRTVQPLAPERILTARKLIEG